MSGISEPIFDLSRELAQTVDERASEVVDRVEEALLKSIKAIWDENPTDLGLPEADYWTAWGIRKGLADLAKDFGLMDDLVTHDDWARRFV